MRATNKVCIYPIYIPSIWVYVVPAMKPHKINRERVQITLHGHVLTRATATADLKGLSLSGYLEELVKEDLRAPKPSAYDPPTIPHTSLALAANQAADEQRRNKAKPTRPNASQG